METTDRNTVEFVQLVERGCGIDVHKSLIVATIKGTGIKEETKASMDLQHPSKPCGIGY